RMGVFSGLRPGESPLKESDAAAPIVRLPRVGFQAGEWHHLVVSWDHFETGKNDAIAQFFVDGKLIGELKNHDIAMRWEIEKTGIYLAVNFIGFMDEVAIFRRRLSHPEIKYLYDNPQYLHDSQPRNRPK
ncbi:MAG: hypothetical protein KDA84_04445, partial [Planctomycetaceae bacterium]|nr:hypothetical protein [Planctomycetaceae bacterium]